VKRDHLPDPVDEAEANGHEHKDQPMSRERFGLSLLRQQPTERSGANRERRENTKDPPDHPGTARAVAPEDDASAYSDHDEVPHERKEEGERFGTRSSLDQGDRAGNGKYGAAKKRAKRQLFHRGVSLRGLRGADHRVGLSATVEGKDADAPRSLFAAPKIGFNIRSITIAGGLVMREG